MVQSNQQIETILAAWLSVGNEFNPHNKLYRHPEFIFRKAESGMDGMIFLV